MHLISRILRYSPPSSRVIFSGARRRSILADIYGHSEQRSLHNRGTSCFGLSDPAHPVTPPSILQPSSTYPRTLPPHSRSSFHQTSPRQVAGVPQSRLNVYHRNRRRHHRRRCLYRCRCHRRSRRRRCRRRHHRHRHDREGLVVAVGRARRHHSRGGCRHSATAPISTLSS